MASAHARARRGRVAAAVVWDGLAQARILRAFIVGKLHPANGDIKLYGGSFVAPQWGPTKNAAFRYRLTVGKIENSRQTVRLYLTPQFGVDAKEFLAFEYVYTRK